MYRQSPQKILPYELGSTHVQAVEELHSRDFIATLVRENLQEAQARMKRDAGKNEDRLRIPRG